MAVAYWETSAAKKLVRVALYPSVCMRTFYWSITEPTVPASYMLIKS